jgi:hypothetical protein
MSGETEAIALTNMTFEMAKPSEGEVADNARIQAGIDAAMRGVIADRYDPTRREPLPTVGVAGAVPVAPAAPLVRGTGWADPRPLALPAGQDAIERLVNAVLPQWA